MTRKAIRKIRERNFSRTKPRRPVHTWTRRLHFYLGLYLLVFIWLFAISGLFLNHPKWEFTHDFWERREEATFEQTVRPPQAARNDLEIAKIIMTQLNLRGEINQVATNPATNLFSFQVSKPGEIYDAEVDLSTGIATVKQTRLNFFGALDALHKFSGVSMRDATRERDWWLTRIWSAAMDAVAVGLIVLVTSGLYLWYSLKAKRVAGVIALGAGTFVGWFFLAGLVRLF